MTVHRLGLRMAGTQIPLPLPQVGASLEAVLSNSGSAALLSVMACAGEQVGAQAQRIEVCGRAVGRSSCPPADAQPTEIAANSTMMMALSVPHDPGKRLQKARPRLPVGSKKTGFADHGRFEKSSLNSSGHRVHACACLAWPLTDR